MLGDFGPFWGSHTWVARPEPGYLLVWECTECGITGETQRRVHPEMPPEVWKNPVAAEFICPEMPPSLEAEALMLAEMNRVLRRRAAQRAHRLATQPSNEELAAADAALMKELKRADARSTYRRPLR